MKHRLPGIKTNVRLATRKYKLPDFCEAREIVEKRLYNTPFAQLLIDVLSCGINIRIVRPGRVKVDLKQKAGKEYTIKLCIDDSNLGSNYEIKKAYIVKDIDRGGKLITYDFTLVRNDKGKLSGEVEANLNDLPIRYYTSNNYVILGIILRDKRNNKNDCMIPIYYGFVKSGDAKRISLIKLRKMLIYFFLSKYPDYSYTHLYKLIDNIVEMEYIESELCEYVRELRERYEKAIKEYYEYRNKIMEEIINLLIDVALTNATEKKDVIHFERDPNFRVRLVRKKKGEYELDYIFYNGRYLYGKDKYEYLTITNEEFKNFIKFLEDEIGRVIDSFRVR